MPELRPGHAALFAAILLLAGCVGAGSVTLDGPTETGLAGGATCRPPG